MKNTTTFLYSAHAKKKTVFLPIILILITAILNMPAIFAFFTDTIGGSINIVTGSLDLRGNYLFYVNGSTTPVQSLSNLSPGDVIVAKATITNNGNKSAWVREGIKITAEDELMPFLSVYMGEKTAAAIEGAPITDRLTLTNGIAFTLNRVLNGSGEGAETETHESYNIIGDYRYDAAFTLYFSTEADETTKNKTLSFAVITQALQYRNNNTSEPDMFAWESALMDSVG